MNNKKLFRSTTNRMVCGVCGGLGDFFGIDATVIRILYVVISLITSAGLLGLILYFILAVIITEDDGISELKTGGRRLKIKFFNREICVCAHLTQT